MCDGRFTLSPATVEALAQTQAQLFQIGETERPDLALLRETYPKGYEMLQMSQAAYAQRALAQDPTISGTTLEVRNLSKSSDLGGRLPLTQLQKDYNYQTKFVPQSEEGPSSQERRTAKVRAMADRYRSTSQSLSMDLTPSDVQLGGSSGDFGVSDGGGDALRETTAAEHQTGGESDVGMVDGYSEFRPEAQNQQVTNLLGCAQTIFHTDLGTSGGGDNTDTFQPTPAPTNFEEDRDKLGAGVSSALFDLGAVTPGQATLSGKSGMMGDNIQAAAGRAEQARSQEIKQGLAVEIPPKVMETPSEIPPQVNINQVLANLVQANRRIASLEMIVMAQQKRLDLVAKTGVAQVAGGSSSSTAQSSAQTAQPEMSAVEEELLRAQQSISAALTSFANRHKSDVM